MREECNHSNCLVLNSDYTPLTIISWQKALTWLVKYESNPRYGIDIIEFYSNEYIAGVNKKYPLPAIAKTKRFFRITNNGLTFSRKNIYIRDNYTCQYCNRSYEIKQLTYDHVIPKSKWTGNLSPTNWTNIVTACVECNRKKGNRTPSQANMKLHNMPIKPNKITKFLPVTAYLDSIKRDMPQEWKQYLPQSYYE